MKMFQKLMMMAALLVVSTVSSVRAEAEKIYVFGNSLIHHQSDTPETTVPHWLAYFARQSGRSFALDGQWGFLRDNGVRGADPQWSFRGVNQAWTRQVRTFDDVGYDTLMINPANFIQYQDASQPYDGDNPDAASPVSAAEKLIRDFGDGKRVVLYEGWADMASFSNSFPPNKRRLKRYQKFNIGDYHDWYVSWHQQLSAQMPDYDISLLPVARILGRALTETDMDGIPADALYLDNAPHGTPSLYFLAAAITYYDFFAEMPVLGDIPATIDPLVIEHFGAFLEIVEQEIDLRKVSQAPVLPADPMPATRLATEDVTPVLKVTASSDLEGVPALGMGLNGIADWSTQTPFVDHMKTARQWIGHLPGQWGGWGQKELVAGGHLDEFGWPMRIPAELDRIETLLLTDIPKEAPNLSGVYRLAYEGTGKVGISGSVRPIRYDDKEIWFRYTTGEGSIGVIISETDPMNTGDHIRNISVVREDQIPLHDLGVVFNPLWISEIQDQRLLRFMDWMFTNGSEIATWDDRPRPQDYSYTMRGVPLGVMLDLVNQVGADPWFNIPHMADNDYVRAFASQVYSHLNPQLVAHAEFSNELWNFGFPQTHWAAQQAAELWGDNAASDAWFHFAGLRAAEVMAIWREVFASDPDRLKRVVATHTGWPGLEEALLEAPLAVKNGASKPALEFDAYAVTGYFGLELGSDELAPQVVDWLQEAAANGQGYQYVTDKAVKALQNGSVKELVTESWPYQKAVADRYGMELIMYEGGTHIVAHGEWSANEDLNAYFKHLNYTPEMSAIYQDLLQSWSVIGGTVFNAFVDVAKPTQYGSWGTQRFLGDSNTRHDVLKAYNAAGPAWATTRAADAFANGVFVPEADAGELITGTTYGDVILAGAGNDEIMSLGGTDYIHGGEGDDHAILPGFLEEYLFYREGTRLRAQSDYGNVRLLDVETIAFSKAPDIILSVSNFF